MEQLGRLVVVAGTEGVDYIEDGTQLVDVEELAVAYSHPLEKEHLL